MAGSLRKAVSRFACHRSPNQFTAFPKTGYDFIYIAPASQFEVDKPHG
jgi:hypothetical protein